MSFYSKDFVSTRVLYERVWECVRSEVDWVGGKWRNVRGRAENGRDWFWLICLFKSVRVCVCESMRDWARERVTTESETVENDFCIKVLKLVN